MKLISILGWIVSACLSATSVAWAESVHCEGNAQGVVLKVDIAPEHMRDLPNLIYLHADATLGDQTLAYRNIVSLGRRQGKIAYVDKVEERSFRLELDSTVPFGHALAGTLVLNEGAAFESRLPGLTCRIEDQPLEPLEPCLDSVKARRRVFVLSRQGSVRQLQDLLACGVTPDLDDGRGCTPLHVVTDLGCGVRTSARPVDHRGRGVLNEEEFVRLLLSTGARIDAQDRDGSTALINAVRSDELSSLSALIEAGPDVNLQDREGMTALMYAAEKGNEVAVETVLDAKPNLALTNRQGKKALDLALENGHLYLRKLLTPRAATATVTGKADGTCSPVMVHVKANREIEFVLDAQSDDMFLLEAPDLGLELMAMGHDTDRKVIIPRKVGTFPFTCGVHGAPADKQTRGNIMVM